MWCPLGGGDKDKNRTNNLPSISGVLLRSVQRRMCVLCSEVGVSTSMYVVGYCSRKEAQDIA